MKVIAFFNLKKETDIDKYNDWVLNRQIKIFQKNLPRMKNFKIYKLVDSDNYKDISQVVQIFDWGGTADEWRETLRSFRSDKSREIYKISQEWRELCDYNSIKILYAENI